LRINILWFFTEISNSVIFTDDSSIAAVQAVTPVLRRLDFFQPVKLANGFETLVYKLPGAPALRIDFTSVFA
jgi:hypothetical protein